MVSLGDSNTLADIDIDKVDSWRGMNTKVVWLWQFTGFHSRQADFVL